VLKIRQAQNGRVTFSNPQPNPQFDMSCTTYAVFGSPRMSVKSL
jgi:hypothetical protein